MPETAVTVPRNKITIENLSKAFDVRANRVVALDQVSLTIGEGEFWCLVGPSGCGKTTLLRILGGLEKQSTGQFTIHAADARHPVTAMVFQERSALPWMSVRDNIAFGLDMRRVARKERDEIVDYYLQAVGLQDFAKALPHQLSGGMQQRVTLARAFATKPDVLLMDEPFGALDQQNRILLQNELLRVWEEEKRRTVVFITHDVEEAIALGDVIAVMSAQPGRILSILRVPFGRPRDVIDLRAEPEFGRVQHEIWAFLRDEVLRARAGENPA